MTEPIPTPPATGDDLVSKALTALKTATIQPDAIVVDLDKARTSRTPAPSPVPDEDWIEREAVDRPDNPLADWLTLPDVLVLPVWARSTASIVANVTALGRLTWWHTRYHSLRTPKYLLKTVLLAARGSTGPA